MNHDGDMRSRFWSQERNESAAFAFWFNLGSVNYFIFQNSSVNNWSTEYNSVLNFYTPVQFNIGSVQFGSTVRFSFWFFCPPLAFTTCAVVEFLYHIEGGVVPRVQLSTQDVLDNLVHNEEENDDGILLTEAYDWMRNNGCVHGDSWPYNGGVFGPPAQNHQVTYPVFLRNVTYPMRWRLWYKRRLWSLQFVFTYETHCFTCQIYTLVELNPSILSLPY